MRILCVGMQELYINPKTVKLRGKLYFAPCKDETGHEVGMLVMKRLALPRNSSDCGYCHIIHMLTHGVPTPCDKYYSIVC